ncbi:MAG: PIG-L family deacetylase [Thermoleophilia bacterium]|jgi:LmbE family N-acetylglucosaminyl deacetylase
MATVTPKTAARLELFLLAHHDDEVFCAGHLRRALAAGGQVRLLWATAGGLAPARRRIAEGARVLEALGLPVTAAVDLRLRDQHAVEHVALIAREVGRLLDADSRGQDDRGRDEVVYVPAYEGGHPDHDAVNLAATLAAAARPGLRVVEFPLYRRGPIGLAVQPPSPAVGTSRERYAVLPLSAEDLALRRALARANSSQLAPSLLPLLALARCAGRGRAEPARPLPAHDYTRAPHAGRLLYELYTPWRFPKWSAAAARSRGS